MLAACEMSGRVRDAFAARGWEAWSADLLATEAPAAYTAYPDGGPIREHPAVLPERPGYHYLGDVRDLFSKRHPVNYGKYLERQRYLRQPDGTVPIWDLVIAFPPCTDLSLAGARYWKQKQADGRQAAAAAFFMEMVDAPAPLVAVENPVGIMGREYDPLYRVPDQVVQPYWFGDPPQKKICLWLKGLPLLSADNLVTPSGRVATGGGSWRTDQKHGRGANNGHEDSEGRARRNIVRSRTLPGFARAMADQWGPFAETWYRYMEEN